MGRTYDTVKWLKKQFLASVSLLVNYGTIRQGANAVAANRMTWIKRTLGCRWTVLAVGIVFLLLHAQWFIRVSPNHQAEVVSGFGAVLIVLGIWLVALPFLRKGIEKATADAMPPPLSGFLVPPEYDESREAQRPQARRDVMDEQVFGVITIVIGTILNGYATPIAHTLHSIPQFFLSH